jgi:anti-sigma B factor antagonist
MLNIEKREFEGKTILHLRGKLDTNTSPIAQQELRALLASGCHNLLLNLQELDYLSSAGLRVLVGTAKEVQGKGFIALCSVNKQVYEVLDMTGLVGLIFSVFNSEEEGLAKL